MPQCITARSILARDMSSILPMKTIFEILGPNVKHTAPLQDNRDLSRKVTDERYLPRFASTHVDHVTLIASCHILGIFVPGEALARGKEGD